MCEDFGYLTMLRESLEKSTDDHDERTQHNRPPTPITLSKPRGERNSKDGTQLVRRVNKAKQSGFNGKSAIVLGSSISKV